MFKHSLFRLLFLFALLLGLLSSAIILPTRAQGNEQTARVDKLFTAWDTKDSPGCALAVIKDGQIVYQRGYGMADLEHDIPITPASVFYVGSVSKQFTAFAVALLAERGKLSLDNDARKYIPELPDYGSPITVRHLVHHTSGLRDYNVLMSLAGRRNDEAFDNQTILEVTARQKELNFMPGEQYLYSNTGYALLALIVERVSGTKFSRFAEENIFKPLGMNDSHFHEDLTRIVKRRADGYAAKAGGGFRLDTPYNERAGAGGLYTTVGDLLKWDRNFYDGRVGGMDFIRRLHTQGKLNSGRTLEYAFALNVTEYKGLKMIEHGGALGGYRAALTRFPDERFSVACLCNLGTIIPDRLVNQIADIYLADAIQQAAAKKPATSTSSTPAPENFISLAESELKEKTGAYLDRATGDVLTLTARDGKIVGTMSGTAVQFAPLSATLFRSVGAPGVAEIEFQRQSPQQKWSLRLTIQGQQPVVFEAVQMVSPNAAQLAEYVGDYFSEELNVTYAVKVEGDKLTFKMPRASQTPLAPTLKDSFNASGGLRFNFQRDRQNRVNGFTVSAGRVRNLHFVRKSN